MREIYDLVPMQDHLLFTTSIPEKLREILGLSSLLIAISDRTIIHACHTVIWGVALMHVVHDSI